MTFLKQKFRQFAGFTLVELLIVIGVIAVLASLAFVALDPLARFQDSRNAQRWTDVNAILSALKLDQVDNGGLYLQAVTDLISDQYYMIGAGDPCNLSCTIEGGASVTLNAECANLEGLLDEGYLQELPIDPVAEGASSDFTHYYLVKHTSGALTVGSCNEEQGSAASIPFISSTR